MRLKYAALTFLLLLKGKIPTLGVKNFDYEVG